MASVVRFPGPTPAQPPRDLARLLLPPPWLCQSSCLEWILPQRHGESCLRALPQWFGLLTHRGSVCASFPTAGPERGARGSVHP